MYCWTTSTHVVAPDLIARCRSAMVASSTRKGRSPVPRSSIPPALLISSLIVPPVVGGALHGPDHAPMCSAPAQIPFQSRGDAGAVRGRIPMEEGTGGDEDAGGAVAALGGLLSQEGLLQRG